MDDKSVKCVGCGVPAHVVLEGGAPERVVCPDCGVSENYDEVVQAIGNQAAVYAAYVLSRSFKAISKGKKNIRYERGNIRRQPSQFRVDLS